MTLCNEGRRSFGNDMRLSLNRSLIQAVIGQVNDTLYTLRFVLPDDTVNTTEVVKC